ncbi:hypothetical protein [Curtobacterium sp. VKM Ac-2884]|uniref:hypothetical protein n=1 Tax=Curtobacterium sp. VKM Ac-2884 TaxID=2783818 RepID=UPI00188B18D5|nr:hypothetical protein [Curtobacterium sp. VKM Ac-2884]MBF4603770.1 hypothetical protein [Curtobacterium sp. VKM Ac-2884]
MTETSFPLAGQDLKDDAWAQTVGAFGSGVLDDWGNPYALDININDTVTIRPSTSGVARAVVNGFGHRLDAPKNLPIPAVSGATWYNIGLLYDPENALLPVSLVVLKGTTVPLDTGQEFCPLYTIIRYAGQTLAAAKLLRVLPRVQPQLLMASSEALLAQSPLLFLYGTEVECTDVGRTYRAAGSPASPRWEPNSTQGVWQGTRDTQTVKSGVRTVLGAFSAKVARNADWMTMSSGAFKLEDGIYVITATILLGSASRGRSFVEIAPSAATGESLARGPIADGEYAGTASWTGFVSASTPLAIWMLKENAGTGAPTVKLSVTRIA